MKRVFLAAMAVGCALFCMCAVAHATTFKCSTAPTGTYTGNIEIEESGSCTISHGLSATGFIKVEASGSTEIQGAVETSGGYVSLNATSGTLEVEGNITAPSRTVVLQSEGNMSLQNINTEGSVGSSVRIFANDGHSGSTPFKIGSAGATNGVGHIYANATSSGGQIYVTNGGSGGISYAGEDVLQVNNSGGEGGEIYLDSRETVGATGPVKLSGKLSVNGSGDNYSGAIAIMAPEAKVEAETTLSADQSSSTGTTTNHFIYLATAKVNLAADLNMEVTGKGDPAGVDAEVAPVGAIAVTVPTDPEDTIPNLSYPSTSEPLTTTGTGELSINTAGKETITQIYGNPLELGKTNIYAAGSGNSVYIWSGTTSEVYNTLTFAGEVKVDAEARQTGSTPGKISVAAKEISELKGSVSLEAQGEEGAAGGTVKLFTSKGEVPLGGSGDNISINVSAQGGGNAGIAQVAAGSGSVLIADENAFYASAFGGNGNAGSIEVAAGAIENVGGANITIDATAENSGKGGKISLTSELYLRIGPGSNEFALETVDESTGGGGIVELSGLEVKVNGGYVDVDAYPSGNGGEIRVHSTKKLYIRDEYALTADGAGNGEGGNISLQAESIEFQYDPYTPVISAEGSGSGAGGHILFEVTGTEELPLFEVEISAKGGPKGEGGYVTANKAVGPTSPTRPINVNAAVHVEAGEETSETTPDGRITLNGVGCSQWKVLEPLEFPKTYWNCVNGEQSYGQKIAKTAEFLGVEIDELLAKTLTPENPSVQIYVMPIVSDMAEFLGLPSNTNHLAAGVTYPQIRFTAVFENVYNESGVEVSTVTATENSTVLESTLVHELGHQLDYIWGKTVSLSEEEPFVEDRTLDFAYMNTLPCETVFPKSLTEACKKYPSTQNSIILEKEFPEIQNTDGLNGTRELFADLFQTIESGDVSGNYHSSASEEHALKYLPKMYSFVGALTITPLAPQK